MAVGFAVFDNGGMPTYSPCYLSGARMHEVRKPLWNAGGVSRNGGVQCL